MTGLPANGLFAAALLALVAGAVAAAFLRSVRARRRIAHRPTDRPTDRSVDLTGSLPVDPDPDPDAARLRRRIADLERERSALVARAVAVADRDREELIGLQEELDEERRMGVEKARLIRSAEAALDHHRRASDRLQARSQRLGVSLAALEAALKHAKRGQARSEAHCATLRERLRRTVPAAAQPAAAERIVYRDREVPVEIPVGFSPLPMPGAGGRRPTNSANRPNSP